MRLRRFASLLVLAFAAACAGGGGSSRATGDPAPRRKSDVLTAAEIDQAHVATAYDAVQRLRPMFLRVRGASTIELPTQFAVVYLDGNPIGGPDALRRIGANDVAEIRYLSGPDATVRFGTGHDAGAILVRTKR